METILFQGDSITDAGRSRDNENNLGYGYATMIKGVLGLDKPNDYQCFNRGISGNRIIDVIARIRKDIINLKPDYMSLLIGVNDVWHGLGATANGVTAEEFEEYYEFLIEKLKKELPELKIMILEPFVLKGYATEGSWDIFRPEVEKRAAVARKIAEKYELPFVALQNKFDEAAKIAPADHWLWDGVHPKAAGHELIKREWLKCFNENFAE